jgi:hypothetical protein
MDEPRFLAAKWSVPESADALLMNDLAQLKLSEVRQICIQSPKLHHENASYRRLSGYGWRYMTPQLAAGGCCRGAGPLQASTEG